MKCRALEICHWAVGQYNYHVLHVTKQSKSIQDFQHCPEQTSDDTKHDAAIP